MTSGINLGKSTKDRSETSQVFFTNHYLWFFGFSTLEKGFSFWK